MVTACQRTRYPSQLAWFQSQQPLASQSATLHYPGEALQWFIRDYAQQGRARTGHRLL